MCPGLQCLVSDMDAGSERSACLVSSTASVKPTRSSPVMVPASRACHQPADKRSATTTVQEAYEAQKYSGRFKGPTYLSEQNERPDARADRTFGLTLQKLATLLHHSTEFEFDLKSHVEELVPSCTDVASGSCCVDFLGKQLREMGYTVWVRQAVGGGSEWFRHLKHTFLLVEGDPQFPEQLYVVDPNFRDQFTIARSTQQYSKLMANLPSVFVGRGKKLLPVIQLVCSEITFAFASQAMEVPPWRRRASMASKWMPDRKKDYVPGN